MRVLTVALALAVVTTLYSYANGDPSEWPKRSHRHKKNSRRRHTHKHHHHFRGPFRSSGVGKSQRRPQKGLSKVHLPHNLKEEKKNIHTEKFSQKSVDKESPDQTQINTRANSVENKWGDAPEPKDDNQMEQMATNQGGYGSVDNAWDKKLNAALNEEDHMVEALHKKTDNVLAREVKSSLPKSFMNELLSPSILKDMGKVAAPVSFENDAPPIPPEPPADYFSQNGARNTKLSQKAKHIRSESDAVEPVLGNDGPNGGGDGGGGKISLPVGVPGSVDEYSSGHDAVDPASHPPALPTSTSNIAKSSLKVNINIGPTTVAVNVLPDQTVGEVALKATDLAEKNGSYEYDPGPLKYHGELLDDNLKFSSYNIPNNAKIRMSPHPKGTIVQGKDGKEMQLRDHHHAMIKKNKECANLLPARCLKWLESLPCSEEVRLAPAIMERFENKLPTKQKKNKHGLFKIWEICQRSCKSCNDASGAQTVRGKGWWKRVKSAIADTDDIVERHYDSFFLVFVSLLGVAGICGICLCCGYGGSETGCCPSFCCCCCAPEKSVEAPFEYSYSNYNFEDDDGMDDAMMYSDLH